MDPPSPVWNSRGTIHRNLCFLDFILTIQILACHWTRENTLDCLDYPQIIPQDGHTPPSPMLSLFHLPQSKFPNPQTFAVVTPWFELLYSCEPHSHITKSLLKHNWLEMAQRYLLIPMAKGGGRELPTPLSATKAPETPTCPHSIPRPPASSHPETPCPSHTPSPSTCWSNQSPYFLAVFKKGFAL